MSAVRCVAIRMSSGGWHHEHITHIKTSDGVVHTRAAMVSHIEGGGSAYVRDEAGDTAYLAVRISAARHKYVQTYADGIWADNLLALPRF